MPMLSRSLSLACLGSAAVSATPGPVYRCVAAPGATCSRCYSLDRGRRTPVSVETLNGRKFVSGG